MIFTGGVSNSVKDTQRRNKKMVIYSTTLYLLYFSMSYCIHSNEVTVQISQY